MSVSSSNPAPPKPFNVLAALYAFTGLMSIADVALTLNKSRKTIYRMVAAHQIPFVRIGSELKFDPSSLIVWLQKKDPTLAQAARHFGMAA